MAVSWFLLLCVSVVLVLLLAVNVYMLVHWSHPDDRNEAYFPKALVVRAIDRSIHPRGIPTRARFDRPNRSIACTAD